MNRRIALTSIAGLAAALLGLAAPVTAQETLKLAVGQKGFWDTSPPEWGQRAGFFKEQGLVLDILYTQGGGETEQAVISGSVDIGVGVGLLGAIGSSVKGAPVKVISSNFTGSSDLFWYVPAASPAKSFKDLAGKTVAYSTSGSSTNLISLMLIEQAGVAAKPTAAGGAPATLTQVMSGQIDVGWSSPPFGFVELDAGKIRIIGRGSDLPQIANQTVRVLLANSNTLDKRREAVRKFMVAYQKTIDWMYDNAQAVDWYAEANKVSVEQAKRAKDNYFPKAALRLGPINNLALSAEQALTYKRITSALTDAQAKQLADIVFTPPG